MLYTPTQSWRASAGLLLLRIIIGLAFVQHGFPKIQHPTSWMTIMMGPHAFAPAWLQAIAAIVEFFGGIALVLGFLTPLVAVGILIDMAVAIFTVHLPMGGEWIGGRMSFEIPLFYFVAMLAFIVAGPGEYSVDAVFGGRLFVTDRGGRLHSRST